MTGADGVLALLLLQWTTGLVSAAAWTQAWSVVRRGHFRIVAWCGLLLGIGAVIANGAAIANVEAASAQRIMALALVIAAGLYLVAQYVRSDVVGVVIGAATAVAGVAVLALSAALLDEWPPILAGALFVIGAALLGAVTNGMLLGHWYLNQPGLKPWALARLTLLSLVAVGLSVVAGLLAAGRLSSTEVSADVLGVPSGGSLGGAFFGVWIAVLVTTGIVVGAARRCVNIRSIQSATGLYYVALLTAGVAQFLVLYLMVNAR